MEFQYFKVYLKGLPDSILKQRGRKNILHLRVASLAGLVEIEFSNGDVIKTNDWQTAAALKHYRVPKIGIKHKPKGETEFKHAYHDHELHKRVRVFKKTKKTTKVQHEVKA